MAGLLNRSFRQLRPAKLALLFTGCLLFSLSDRAGQLTYEQHLLSAVSDHYYLLYFMLPVMLLCYFPYFEDDSEIFVGRFPRYISYFFCKWAAMGAIAACMVGTQSVAISLSSIGRGMGNSWELPVNSIDTELFAHLQSYFPSPLCAFLAISAFQWLGMWFAAGLFMWICHFTNARTATMAAALMYVYSVLWIKAAPLQKLPFSGLNHFSILHHNLIAHNRLYLTLGTEAALLIIVWATTLCRRGLNAVSARNGVGINGYYRKTLFTLKNAEILLLVLAGVTIYKTGQGMGIASSQEWLEHFFAGHGISYFRPLPFLEMLMINGAPLYLLAGFIERFVSGQSLFVPVRVSTRKKMTQSCLTIGIEFISLYCLLACVFAGCSGAMRGFEINKGDVLFFLLLIGLKAADCYLQYFTMLLIYYYTKQITVGFVALVIGNLLCMLPEAISKWIPFGVSSVARFYEAGPINVTILSRIGYTLTLSALLGAWTIYVGRKKQFD